MANDRETLFHCYFCYYYYHDYYYYFYFYYYAYYYYYYFIYVYSTCNLQIVSIETAFYGRTTFTPEGESGGVSARCACERAVNCVFCLKWL